MKQTFLRYLPNIITAIRLVAVIPLVWLLLIEDYVAALVVFAIAGVSDGVDGYLARRFHWQSHWGAVMDPLADKLLMFMATLMLLVNGVLPLWLFGLILSRDLLIVGGAALYRYRFGPFDVAPSRLGKISTFFQILLVLSLLLHSATGLMSDIQINYIISLCALVTIASGAQYLYVWIRKAINE